MAKETVVIDGIPIEASTPNEKFLLSFIESQRKDIEFLAHELEIARGQIANTFPAWATKVVPY